MWKACQIFIWDPHEVSERIQWVEDCMQLERNRKEVIHRILCENVGNIGHIEFQLQDFNWRNCMWTTLDYSSSCSSAWNMSKIKYGWDFFTSRQIRNKMKFMLEEHSLSSKQTAVEWNQVIFAIWFITRYHLQVVIDNRHLNLRTLNISANTNPFVFSALNHYVSDLNWSITNILKYSESQNPETINTCQDMTCSRLVSNHRSCGTKCFDTFDWRAS